MLLTVDRFSFRSRFFLQSPAAFFRRQSEPQANDLRSFDQSYFVMVVSTDAWEMHATQTLVKAMESPSGAHMLSLPVSTSE